MSSKYVIFNINSTFQVEVVQTDFFIDIYGKLCGDPAARRGSNLSVGSDEKGRSGKKDPQSLIQEKFSASFNIRKLV